jgi:hypothetical protein
MTMLCVDMMMMMMMMIRTWESKRRRVFFYYLLACELLYLVMFQEAGDSWFQELTQIKERMRYISLTNSYQRTNPAAELLVRSEPACTKSL